MRLKNRPDKTGRSERTDRYLRLDHAMLYSPAYRGLSLSARVLLIEVAALYNGSNNGELFLSVRDAAKLMGVVEAETASRAFHELVEHGFIQAARPGHFGVKERHATVWRLTWLPLQGKSGPSHEWRGWRAPAGTKAARRIIDLLECKLRSAFSGLSVGIFRTEGAIDCIADAKSVRKNPTVESETPAIAAPTPVGIIPTQVLSHTGASERADLSACKATRTAARRWLAAGRGRQKDIAGRIGVSEAKLSRFLSDEAGRRTLTVDQLLRLDAFLRRSNLPVALSRRQSA